MLQWMLSVATHNQTAISYKNLEYRDVLVDCT